MFTKTLRELSIFPCISKRSISSRILHVTDSEGNYSSFLSAINNSKTVQFHSDKGLSFYNTKEIPYFIFGGDATDRGNSDIVLSEMLLDFKKRYPEQVYLLVGNRDITKNRFKIELDSEQIRSRLLNSQTPRWLPHNPTLPLDYVNEEMKTQKYSGSVIEFVNSLSIEQSQLIYLKWMLEKTMGCPHGFRYRKEELERTHPNSIVTDTMVLHSFIKESSPEGVNGKYLQEAQVGVIIPNTGVLAVHGGLQADNIGRVPGMSNNDKSIPDGRAWIAKFNNWYKKQITNWIDYRATDLTEPAFTALDECVLPLPGKAKSIITADMLDPSRQFREIPDQVSQYLRENGIHVVLTGHQPCGDHPVILRGNGLLFINGDTGYAAFNPQVVDDTRGGATHTLEILANEQGAEIDLQATLPNKTNIRTQLTVQADVIKGDSYVGFITEKQELVQCLLPNGNYRLVSQKGFNVKYSELPGSEVSQLIDLDEKNKKYQISIS